ncbi:MAG TPA: PSD1 and planctomycete cytochrome C domain-containing protein [Pirellulales bacterium]|nr:PSD1 and planctomycete cytochrome C domain-containing protein [Pirellulales bacterium]
MKNFAVGCVVLVLTATLSRAGEAPDYVRDVRPLLKERCYACHAALKQEGNLRLDTAAAVRTGGDSGAAIVPNKPGESLLIGRVSARDENERMPPDGLKPLSAEQIAIFSAWIASGAAAPADDQPEPDPRQHWAFQPPRRTSLPEVGWESPVQNPIDALLAAEHARHGLRPLGETTKPLLLRRAYLDLIGLPPTRNELADFLADDRPDAYERVIDRLLASPRYGERWGRHWMDVWRYSDWFGLGDQLRNSQKHIWHWRDWIVESLNADRSYDRLVMEMLAGDELAPNDRDTLRATGFLARNYYLFNRTTWLDETIEHTAKAFLGLTINCAKCHDHKYDPISQLDYYRLRAIFEPHQVRLDPLPGVVDLERDGLPRVFDAHLDVPTWLHKRGNEKEPDQSRPIEPGLPAVLAQADFAAAPVELPPASFNPATQAFVLEDQLRAVAQEIDQKRAAVANARHVLAEAEKREAVPLPADPVAGKLIIDGAFAQEEAAVWEAGPGKWSYADGHLVQSQSGATRSYWRTRQPPPVDFHARLKVNVTGGDVWRSVGLSFDVVGEREKLVYISAHSEAPKVQIAYKAGNDYAYPPQGATARTIEIGRPHELELKVRGRLLNVALDGEHLLAFWLPVEREAGRLDLITFDATAEFHHFELRELSPGAPMVQAAGGPPEFNAAQARAAVAVAERALAAAELRPETLRTAHAAETAQACGASGDESARLVGEAAFAGRRFELAQAAEQVAIAEQKLAAADEKSRPELEKQLASSRDALAKAEAALQNPGDKYTALRASLKALEGPDEKADSRNAPYPHTSTGRRTALARWIVARDNPLTARVAVNHVWMRHFGQPLVESVEDFGRRAPAPPLQPVLDWLAVDLMDHDWSLKRLHRVIVTSAAYRRGSSPLAVDETTAKNDPTNRYLWRRRPQRMESEVVRDGLLHLAGALDPRMGGPTIDPKNDAAVFRRSLYFTHSRDDQNEFLSMFDDADVFRCYRRTESIVPQQALTMANSRLTLTMARQLAARLNRELDAGELDAGELGAVDDTAFVNAAFEAILCSPPESEELAACLETLAEIKRVLVAQNHPQPNQRAREDLVHALLNHNDFLTIR